MYEIIKPYNYIWLIPLCCLAIIVILCTCFLLRKEIYKVLKTAFFPTQNRYSIPSAILSRITGTMPVPTNPVADDDSILGDITDKPKTMHHGVFIEPRQIVSSTADLIFDQQTFPVTQEPPLQTASPNTTLEQNPIASVQTPVTDQAAPVVEPPKPMQGTILAATAEGAPTEQVQSEPALGTEQPPQLETQQTPSNNDAKISDVSFAAWLKSINLKKDVLSDRKMLIIALLALLAINIFMCARMQLIGTIIHRQRVEISILQQELEIIKTMPSTHTAHRPAIVYKIPIKTI